MSDRTAGGQVRGRSTNTRSSIMSTVDVKERQTEAGRARRGRWRRGARPVAGRTAGAGWTAMAGHMKS